MFSPGYTQILPRIYPPTGYYDTISIVNGKVFSAHGDQKIFEDAEIKQIHLRISSNEGLEIRINELGKHLLQQQSTRGCTAAVAAMLLLDHGRKINHDELSETNLRDDAFICKSLKKGWLRAVLASPIREMDPLHWLSCALDSRGSAIITIDGDFGGHVVIVDHILQENGIRIREPYHGWDITLQREAFQKYWQIHSPIIQIDPT